jgi:hypothetical protein
MFQGVWRADKEAMTLQHGIWGCSNAGHDAVNLLRNDQQPNDIAISNNARQIGQKTRER